MANWFKCPECGKMIEQGQVKEIKDHTSAGIFGLVSIFVFVCGAIAGASLIGILAII